MDHLSNWISTNYEILRNTQIILCISRIQPLFVLDTLLFFRNTQPVKASSETALNALKLIKIYKSAPGKMCQNTGFLWPV